MLCGNESSEIDNDIYNVMQANWEAVSPFCTTCLMHYATFGDCHLKFDGIEWATDVVLRHAVWQQLGH